MNKYNNSPYEKMPDELHKLYTLDNKIPIIQLFYNSVKNKKSILWKKRRLDKWINENSEKSIISGGGISNYDKPCLKWILNTIKKYNIIKKKSSGCWIN